MPETHSQSCDVLVVGGGPAGIAAATRAAERGLKTVLVDDNLQLGGQIWRAPAGRPLELNRQATVWIDKLKDSKATIHLENRVVARVSERQVLVEGKSGAKEISYGDLIIATGARERFLPFPGWTLPNVTGAGGLQALVKGGLPVSRKKIVVAGSGPTVAGSRRILKEKRCGRRRRLRTGFTTEDPSLPLTVGERTRQGSASSAIPHQVWQAPRTTSVGGRLPRRDPISWNGLSLPTGFDAKKSPAIFSHVVSGWSRILNCRRFSAATFATGGWQSMNICVLPKKTYSQLARLQGSADWKCHCLRVRSPG